MHFVQFFRGITLYTCESSRLKTYQLCDTRHLDGETTIKYAQIHADFWTTQQARAIAKAGVYAQLLAIFLRTGPHATYSGLYRLPLGYIAGDLNMSLENVEAAMRALEAAGYAKYDYDNEYVFVVDATADYLRDTSSKRKPGAGVDNKVKGVVNSIAEVPNELALKLEYVERYAELLKLDADIIEEVRVANGVASVVAKPAPAPQANVVAPTPAPASETVVAPAPMPELEQEPEPEPELDFLADDEADELAVAVVAKIKQQAQATQPAPAPAQAEVEAWYDSRHLLTRDFVAEDAELRKLLNENAQIYKKQTRHLPTMQREYDQANRLSALAGVDKAKAELKRANKAKVINDIELILRKELEKRGSPEDLELLDLLLEDI